MKKQIILPIALLGFALAACNKQEPAATGGANPASPAAQPPQVSLETKLTGAYGFAAKAPANIEGYCAFYDLGKLWHDIKQSPTLAAIRTNPLVTQVTGDASFASGYSQFSKNPEANKWRVILSDALGNETFFEFSPGSSAILASWIRFNDENRMANIKSALAGRGAAGSPPKNPYDLQSMLPFLKTLEAPPVVVGFKMGAQKAALNAELDNAEKNLPPGAELTTFSLNGNIPFKSLVVVLGKVVPAPYQTMLKNMVAQAITDPKEADDTYQALLARRVEIAYGYVGDYFVASIGTDHAHLKLAANFGESVLARPEVAVAANYADKPLLSFSWSSPELMAGMQRKLQLSPYYEKLKPEITRSLASGDAEKLAADLKRLDTEADAAFAQNFTPMVGVCYRDRGLRGEMFGGIKATGSASLKFSTVPPADTFLWVDSVSDPVRAAALRVWFEDLATTSYDTFQRVGLPLVSDAQRMQFGLFQTMGLPKLVDLYKISRDQFAKSLGSETAVAIDLNGEIPALPMIPAALHDGGRMFRIACMSDVQDRALLGQSWTSYLKLLREIAQMIPQAAMLPGGIPDATSEVVDGVTLSYYKPPLETGDLLPNIATTDKTFVISTSHTYSLALTKSALKAAAPAKPLTLDFHVNFKAAIDSAVTWMALAAQYPNIFFSGNQAKADEFKKMQPDLTSLLNALRPLQGMSGQVFEENGVRRMSSAIIWQK